MGIFRQAMTPAVVFFVISIALGACTPRQPNEDRQRAALIAVGKKVFTDKTLSRDGTISCASCHQSDRFFTDSKPVSIGLNAQSGTRNAPSLLDVKLMSSLFWDGRAKHLQDVVIQPLTNPVEMGSSTDDVLRRVGRSPDYTTLSRAAFGDDTLSMAEIGTALAAYLRSLPLRLTRYDLYAKSGKRSDLSENEKQGLSLFRGKATCAECHRLEGTPAALTDNQFHHTGVGFERVAGNIGAMIRKLDQVQRQKLPMGTVILTDHEIAEVGRFAVTRRPADLGAFRTPSLRNVVSTAPYMHDGSIPTLQAAVEREIYYRSLARGQAINLTVEEQGQLIAFLETLSTPAH